MPDDWLEAFVRRAHACLGSLGVGLDQWSSTVWHLSPQMFKLTGRNVRTVTLSFEVFYSGNQKLHESWLELAKAIIVLRQHRRPISITSHRAFLTSLSYVSRCSKGRHVAGITPNELDQACALIVSEVSSQNQQYKYCVLVSELAVQWLGRYGLCSANLENYRARRVKRPAGYGGADGRRLDDPEVLKENSARVISNKSLVVLGELYQKVPPNHHYRIFILLLVVLFCLGRRFSEVSWLPKRCIVRRGDGFYFRYIQTKSVSVSERLGYLMVPIPKLVVNLLRDVVAEIKWSSRKYYATAVIMRMKKGPDLAFLDDIPEDQPLSKKDVFDLGFPEQCFNGWFKHNDRLGVVDSSSGRPVTVVHKRDLVDYCAGHFWSGWLKPVAMLANEDVLLTDLLFLRPLSLSSGFLAKWIVRPITHAMLNNFLRYIDKMAEEYCSSCFDRRFTSHDFRHTINDALDKGGLSDLMQTEFFGRRYAADTKLYQHSSPQYRALQIREKIRLGQVGGAVADRAMNLPVDQREFYLSTEVRSVHDIGLGLCLHAWSHGPCPKHLECTSGCDKFSWLKDSEGEYKGRQIEEIKRQIAHNLLVLANAFDYCGKKVGGVDTWVTHLFIKIKTLKEVFRDTDPSEADFCDFGAYWFSVVGSNRKDWAKIDAAHRYFINHHVNYLQAAGVKDCGK